MAATLAGCSDLTNPPVTTATLELDQSATFPQTEAGDSHTLTMFLEEGELIQFRAWSVGLLYGVELTIDGPDGSPVWSSSSRGAEIRAQAVRAGAAGRYTATVTWEVGGGVAGYRYHRLSIETPTVSADWSTSLNEARSGHTMTRLPDGRMLVVGGHLSGSGVEAGKLIPLASAEVIDPVTQTISRVGELAQARAFHAAVLVPSGSEAVRGKVLIIGGLGADGGALLTTELFDPADNTFEAGPLLPQPRAYPIALSVEGTGGFLDRKILIGGGERTRKGPQHDQVTLAYSEVDENPREIWYFDNDAPDQIVENLPALEQGRLYGTFSLLGDGRILIVGGGVDTFPNFPSCEQGVSGTCICSQEVPLCTEFTDCVDGACTVRSYTRKDLGTRKVEVYDTQTNMRTTLDAQLIRGRVGHSAVVLAGDLVVIAGGATAVRRSFWPSETGLPEFPAILDSVELFDPQTNSFSALPGLALPRAHHRVVRLGDGSIYLVGGMAPVPGGVEGVNLVERFEPDLRRFTSRDLLGLGSIAPAVAPVADGSGFFVVGGERNGEPHADVQRFNVVDSTPR